MKEGAGSFEDCGISGNAKAGVETKCKGDPTARNSRINRNTFQAVWALGG